MSSGSNLSEGSEIGKDAVALLAVGRGGSRASCWKRKLNLQTRCFEAEG